MEKRERGLILRGRQKRGTGRGRMCLTEQKIVSRRRKYKEKG